MTSKISKPVRMFRAIMKALGIVLGVLAAVALIVFLTYTTYGIFLGVAFIAVTVGALASTFYHQG